jgi:hypothetical protein
MKELISPAQSETLVLIFAILSAIIGAIYGFRVLGARGILLGVVGIVVYASWQLHKYVTRFDPQTGYFGLDKVNVLLLEVVAVVVFGATFGVLWSKITRLKSKETEDNATDLL